jgi:hypothetical protein
MIKRYEHECESDGESFWSCMEEDKDGDYVKYEDIKHLIKKQKTCETCCYYGTDPDSPPCKYCNQCYDNLWEEQDVSHASTTKTMSVRTR